MTSTKVSPEHVDWLAIPTRLPFTVKCKDTTSIFGVSHTE